MTEKPLHVQVAEALGWVDLEQRNGMDRYSWYGWYAPMELGKRNKVPAYDSDWSATGPLIEEFKFEIWYQKDPTGLDEIFGKEDPWRATHKICSAPNLGAETGVTPLIAVCKLILLLHRERKLQDARRLQ